MMLHSLTTSGAAGQALAWLLTYAIHSTLLLAAAWAVSRRLGGRWLRLQETLWRCALVGALLTTSAQLAFGGPGRAPIAGRWTLASPGAPGASLAPAAAVAATAAGTPAEALGAVDAAAAARSAAPAARLPEGRAVAGRVAIAAAWAPAVAAGTRPSVARVWLLPLRALLLPAWILGALGFTIGTVRSYLSLRRRLRYRPQVVGGGVLARLAVLVGDSGISRRVRLTCTWRLRVPVALGLRAAEVCVPPRALFELDDEQQDALLAHELAHLARRDPVWLLVTQLVVGVFFFQPLNWLARRRLRELSELLCDEWAVARTGRPLSLAACLAEVAGWSLAALGALASDTARRQPSRLPVPGMADRPSQLAHRIRRLLDGVPPAPPEGRGPDRARLALIVAAVLLAVTLAAPGIYAGSPPGAPAATGAGGANPAVMPSASAAAVPIAAAQVGARPAVQALMVVAALAEPVPDPAPAPVLAPTPTAAPGASTSAVTAPAPRAAPETAAETAAAPELAAERERLAAAASRLEQLDKLSTLSEDQLAAIAQSVERISREIDGKLAGEIERLNHRLAAARAAGPHREDLPAAELADLDGELAGVVAQLHPSPEEMAALGAELRDLDASLTHLTAEEMKHVQEEAKRALAQMPKLGLSRAEHDRLRAELSRALEQLPKAGLTEAEIEHLRADVERAIQESAAATAHRLSRADRDKIIADARRLAEQVHPDELRREALRALEHEHEELSRVLAAQRAEIEAVRREIRQETQALREQARRLSESRRLHPRPRSERHSRPASPPGPAAPAAPGAPAAPPAPPTAAAPSPPPAASDSAPPPPGT